MKKPIQSRNSSYAAHSERGVALVLTLSVLVIATVIVVAFFFRSRFDTQGTAAYSNQVSAKELASAGTAQVIAYLQAEAEKGGTTIGTGSTHFFKISDPKKMVPVPETSFNSSGDMNGIDDPYGNLVKQSIGNVLKGDLAPKISKVGTDQPALDGRKLDGKYWSKPQLTVNEFAAAQVPQWIYVAANGKSVTEDDTGGNRIVGRYAFNVYDVGGLLDINAAGFDTAGKNVAGQKGSLVFADLVALADDAGVQGFTAGTLADLNQWRYGSTLTSADWTAKPGTNGQVSDNLEDLLRSGPLLASLGKYPPGLETGHLRRNQNAFLSRLDLIRYFESKLGKVEAAKLLPYLTDFTRDINAPTLLWNWTNRPTLTTGRNSVGGNTEAAQINPDVWNAQGQSLLPRRFALDQIDLLKLDSSGSNPESSDSDEIKRAFGLSWDGANRTWVYDNTKLKTSSNGQPRFRTLDEVRTDGESPNFFEVLSAAINCASLGQQLAGVAPVISPSLFIPASSGGGTDPAASATPNNRPHAVGLDDSNVAYHVARIGAAIIDQWDGDSLPTTVEINGRTIFGVEDLPYLHGFKRLNYYGTAQFTVGGVGTVLEGGTFLHPQIWNPHAKPATAPNVAKPTRFRVVPYTNTINSVKPGSLGTVKNNPPTNQPQFSYGTDFGRPNIWFDSNGNSQQHDSANGGVNYTLKAITDKYSGAGALGNLETYSTSGANPEPDQLTDWMEFSDIGDSFREPVLLWTSTKNGLNKDVAVKVSNTGTTKAEWPIDGARNKTATQDSSARVGFRLGKYYVNATPNGNTTGAPWAQIDLQRYRGWAEYFTRANFALEYLIPGKSGTSASDWQIYDIMYDVVDLYTPSASVQGAQGAGQDQVWRVMGRDQDATYRVDPRVERFGPQSKFYRVTQGSESKIYTDMTYYPPNSTGWDASNKMFAFYTADGGQDWRFMAYNIYPRGKGVSTLLAQWPLTSFGSTFNNFVGMAFNRQTQGVNSLSTVRYLDPDGLLRLGSAGWAQSVATAAQNPLSPNASPSAPANGDARPIVLNRPFQSVAEIGYACRDLPWKSVDFWDSNTGDAAILDYFCLHAVDNDPILDPNAEQLATGVLNLNSANPKVLAAVLAGTSAIYDGTQNDSKSVDTDKFRSVARALASWVRGTGSEGPFLSRADLAGKMVNKTTFASPFGGQTSGTTTSTRSETADSQAIRTALGDNSYYDARRTSLMRALVDSTGVRTWNFMIDVTAQSGKVIKPKLLESFAVDGQARFWVFVAIDRFTGKVIDKRIESVD